MKRALLTMLGAATAGAVLAGSGFAIPAMAQSDHEPTHAELVERWAQAAIDSQLKGMKASLRLTAEQEKDWPPFETAVKQAESDRLAALQKEQASNLTPMDRLNAKAERLAQSQAGLDKMVAAARPLYESLSDAQKHKFIALGRMLVPERGRFVKAMRRAGAGAGDEQSAE